MRVDTKQAAAQREEAYPDGAGLIPYVIQEGKVYMLFMVPSDPRYGGHLPQIAKGRIDAGESPKQAAVREASEELGVLPTHYDSAAYPIHSQTFRGTALHIFAAEMNTMDIEVDDSHEETLYSIWLTEEEFDYEGREWQRPIIRKLARHIEATQ